MNLFRSPRGGALFAATLFFFLSHPPVSAAEPVVNVSKAITTSSTDIASFAQILHDGTNWTMIPRGAVLNLPRKHRSKLGGSPVGNLVSWKEFLAINGAWLTGEDVSLRQAEGSRPIDPRRLTYLSKQKRMVVAVYQGSPIAVVDAR